jgi:tRNA-specific 2-thiouridylase
VIDDFVAEHGAGRTPNPCARCNGEIKFGAFLRRADKLGIDLVATGHYVRTERDPQGGWHLLRGSDAGKDQTYMLHMLGQDQLTRSLFPVGGIPKAETRALAERFGLPVASKPDSQELCFAPSGDAGAFVRSTAPQLVREGAVVDPDGRAIATHDGTFGFTVGQRRGLGVATGERTYVVELDAPSNRVVVGPQELLSRRGLLADRVSWVAGRAPGDGPFEASVRIRYRGHDVAAVIEPLAGDRIRVEFRSPQRAVAPGQSVVVYLGEELVGGGRIVEALR